MICFISLFSQLWSHYLFVFLIFIWIHICLWKDTWYTLDAPKILGPIQIYIHMYINIYIFYMYMRAHYILKQTIYQLHKVHKVQNKWIEC